MAGAQAHASLGAGVRLADARGEDARGALYAACRGAAALTADAGEGRVDVTIVRADVAKEGVLKEVKAPDSGSKDAANAPLPPVDLDLVAQREAAAVKKAEAAGRKIGVGVSAHAQKVFDALQRTMECSWDGPCIVVLDEVRISPPYDTTAVAGGQATPATMLDRVVMVLGNVLQTLAK
eukprot:PRCOL_00005775-RA